jgi:biofilm PGA synthesis N-glycosyltransferase PgaC
VEHPLLKGGVGRREWQNLSGHGNNKTFTTALNYVLITPARNEAQFIESAINAVTRQTVRPLKWVIVSDGSTDATDDIVRGHTAAHPWIELIRMPERRDRHFAGKAAAFNAGLARVRNLPYDVIGNLDADVSFDERYCALLLHKFEEDPTLGVAGTPFKDPSLEYDYRFVSIEHVSGPCQMFRRECFEAIGGYQQARLGGVDHIAVISARMNGWRTQTYQDTFFVHRRPMGSCGQNALRSRFRNGAVDYALGSHPVWELCRAAYQMTRRPHVVGALMLLAGYLSAAVRGEERSVSREFVEFHRREQMQRLRAFLSAPLRPRSRGPAAAPAFINANSAFGGHRASAWRKAS